MFKALKTLTSSFFSVILTVAAILTAGLFWVKFTACEHPESVKRYSFYSENNMSYDYMAVYCKECNEKLRSETFADTPKDLSYLEVVRTLVGEDGPVAGEYYLVTATVLSDYSQSGSPYVRCKVENDSVSVFFNVDFKEEFGDAVREIKADDTITFYGRYYESGCGFADCELIVE